MKLKFNLENDIPNINGITFTQTAIDNAISKYNKLVLDNRALGRTGYGSSYVLDVSKTSFIIKSITNEGGQYYGDIEVLNTPEGLKLKDKIRESCKIGLMMFGDVNSGIVDKFEILYPIIMNENNTSLINELMEDLSKI